MQCFMNDSYRDLLDLLDEKLLGVQAGQVASVINSPEQLSSAGCSQLLAMAWNISLDGLIA